MAVVVVAMKTPAAAMQGLWRVPALTGIQEQWTVTESIKKTRRISGSMVSSDRVLARRLLQLARHSVDGLNDLFHLKQPSTEIRAFPLREY